MMGDIQAFHWQGQMTPGRMAVSGAMAGTPTTPQTQPTFGPQQFGGSHARGSMPINYGLQGLGVAYQRGQPSQSGGYLGWGGHNGYR